MDTTLIQSAVLPLASGLTLCDDGLIRPTWASHDELLRSYYDTEWGLPIHDEAGVFERLVLEGFQAGLSWRTVLAKREAFRQAFDGFVPDRVAAFTSDDVDHLVSTPGIIHNRRKIEAAISNARATVAMRNDSAVADGPSHLGELVWSYRPTLDPLPRSKDEVPTQLPESVALAADLKSRGFCFVGPTTMLALMAAIGIVNTDIVGTHRRPR
ncbi:methyladenine glycosylase [Actinomyces sp. ICM54]|uniref:DNA-3-methyladenine glycosylase I n=1 Tax=Actinomyces sp. ICM54 TaxID=936549 RepID=UPI00044D2444|nr:DNA-3-methyladenine glycosylase I [Actinomyces sp. ICM54]EWC95650.1 methyladenine glycosylase [Actinomyces sp. ICM54]